MTASEDVGMPDVDLSDRRVLVTGGLGFLGLNTVGGLLDRGAQVRIVSRSRSATALEWLDRIAAARPVELVIADVGTAAPGVSPWLEGLDAVVHLAGESGAAWSLDRPSQELHGNVEAQLFFLDALRRMACPPHVVFVSSRLVYGAGGGVPVDERSPVDPTSLYAAHKLTVENYLKVYGRSTGLPWTILRVTNPYGPFQPPATETHGVVNRFVQAAIASRPITIYGDGSQLRDVLHVDDVVRAILLSLGETAARSEVLNVGAGRSLPLAEIARRVVAIARSGTLESRPWPESDLRVETGDFRCSTARIAGLLGWQPRIDLDEGLERTVRAYRDLFASGAPGAEPTKGLRK